MQLSELSEFDVIVNSSGIGAKYLVDDDNVFPIRGQIARVYAPWQFSAVQVGGNYIIPNINCVILGGTKQKEYNTEINPADTEFILAGCAGFVPALINAKVVKHQVGLRPGRTQVRLEMKLQKMGGRLVKVLHNYGHGGSGITLCIGCANEAVEIIQHALNQNKSKL